MPFTERTGSCSAGCTSPKPASSFYDRIRQNRTQFGFSMSVVEPAQPYSFCTITAVRLVVVFDRLPHCSAASLWAAHPHRQSDFWLRALLVRPNPWREAVSLMGGGPNTYAGRLGSRSVARVQQPVSRTQQSVNTTTSVRRRNSQCIFVRVGSQDH
jgi:hypothetical protein